MTDARRDGAAPGPAVQTAASSDLGRAAGALTPGCGYPRGAGTAAPVGRQACRGERVTVGCAREEIGPR
jgi:hypothetical protein